MSRNLKDFKHTLVQHSGFGYGSKVAFYKGVETRTLETGMDVLRVAVAGGLIYNSYAEAEDAAEAENYPEEHTGIIPCVEGTFADLEIDGLRVYIRNSG
jgi:hypothetical protein